VSKKPLLGLALVGDGVDLGLDGGWVADVVLVEDVPVLVEGVGAGDAGRDVDLEDLLGGELLELHHEGAKAVAVGGDENALAGNHLGLDVLLEVGPGTGDGVLQALGVGEVLGGHVTEHLKDVRIARIVGLEGRRAYVKRATPDLDLGLAVLGGGIGLVQALEGTVVALVELPCLGDGEPVAVELVEHAVERVDGALEKGRVAEVKVVASLLESLAAGMGLLAAGVREVDVGPTCEEVLEVPLRLAVTDDDEGHGLVVVHRRIPFP